MSFDGLEITRTCQTEATQNECVERTRREIEEKFRRLSPANQDRVALFIILLVDCPGFWAELKEATPEGEVIPPKEALEALMEKWKGEVA